MRSLRRIRKEQRTCSGLGWAPVPGRLLGAPLGMRAHRGQGPGDGSPPGQAGTVILIASNGELWASRTCPGSLPGLRPHSPPSLAQALWLCPPHLSTPLPQQPALLQGQPPTLAFCGDAEGGGSTGSASDSPSSSSPSSSSSSSSSSSTPAAPSSWMGGVPSEGGAEVFSFFLLLLVCRAEVGGSRRSLWGGGRRAESGWWVWCDVCR